MHTLVVLAIVAVVGAAIYGYLYVTQHPKLSVAQKAAVVKGAAAKDLHAVEAAVETDVVQPVEHLVADATGVHSAPPAPPAA